MAEYMHQEGLPFAFLNARDMLIVSEAEGQGTTVHWDISETKLNTYIEKATKENSIKHLMITGYIATNLCGVATTLKRDGSDFSASIFGTTLSRFFICDIP